MVDGAELVVVQTAGDEVHDALVDEREPDGAIDEFAIEVPPDRGRASWSAEPQVFAAALAEGYEDHGGPGERTVYHPGYYGAFVLDPDGHNIEVVNHNRG